MCRSMVDIQSASAEIRRVKKKKPRGKNIMACSILRGGHKIRKMRNTPCLKKVPPSTCYNLDIHNPITKSFGRSVTEKVRNYTMRKKTDQIKQLVEFRQCTNTSFEGNMQFSRFFVLPASAEARVI